MATIRTGKTFIFKEDAEQIQFEPLKIDSVMEYAEDMTDENLKEYIRKEMQNFQNDRIHDMEQIESERQRLHGFISQMENEALALDQNASVIRNKQAQAEDTLEQTKSRILSKKGEFQSSNEQLADVNKLITGMKENKAKFVKACDKDSLAEIKKIMKEQKIPTAIYTEVLDLICRFVTAKKDATFMSEGDTVMQSADIFTSNVKNSDASSFEKADIQKIAQDVNMDSEGQKGRILRAITDQPATTAPLIPYFKVLFKLTQIEMTKKTKAVLESKQDACQKEMDQQTVELLSKQANVDNLNFHARMTEEANRARGDEINAMKQKSMQLEHKIYAYRKYAGPNFADEYFQ